MNGLNEFSEEVEPLDAEFDELDGGLVNVAEQLLQSLDALIQLQQQQLAMIGMLSQQMQMFMTAPRRVIRDDAGRVIGATIEGQ